MLRKALMARRSKRVPRLPKQAQPNTERLAYKGALLHLIAPIMVLVRAHFVPMLSRLVAKAGAVHDSADYPDDVEAALDRIAYEYFKELGTKPENVARAVGKRVSEKQRKELEKQTAKVVGNISLEPFTEPGIADRVQAFVSANASLIKDVPRGLIADIKKRSIQSLRDGKRPEEIAQELEDRWGVAESRAELIARDQVGKLYGEVNQARQENLGVTGYIWRTSEDERVRPEHEERDGEHFEWDDPPEDGHPGFPIQCRCIAEPDLEALVSSLE